MSQSICCVLDIVEAEPELEPEPEPEANAPWSSLLTKLELSSDESLAEAGRIEEDEAITRLRVAVLDAEQDEARVAAMTELLAKKDEEKEAALAKLAAEKDAELAALRAQLSAQAD